MLAYREHHNGAHRGPLHGLIGILILTTVLWGTAVSAHQHIELQHELCEICLLPQIGDLPATTLALPCKPGACDYQLYVVEHRDAVPALAYQSRAPPR